MEIVASSTIPVTGSPAIFWKSRIASSRRLEDASNELLEDAIDEALEEARDELLPCDGPNPDTSGASLRLEKVFLADSDAGDAPATAPAGDAPAAVAPSTPAASDPPEYRLRARALGCCSCGK